MGKRCAHAQGQIVSVRTLSQPVGWSWRHSWNTCWNVSRIQGRTETASEERLLLMGKLVACKWGLAVVVRDSLTLFCSKFSQRVRCSSLWLRHVSHWGSRDNYSDHDRRFSGQHQQLLDEAVPIRKKKNPTWVLQWIETTILTSTDGKTSTVLRLCCPNMSISCSPDVSNVKLVTAWSLTHILAVRSWHWKKKESRFKLDEPLSPLGGRPCLQPTPQQCHTGSLGLATPYNECSGLISPICRVHVQHNNTPSDLRGVQP